MNDLVPSIYGKGKSSAEVVNDLLKELESTTNWRRSATEPGAGEAMVRLFGRLTDILIARLNQTPENHFRTFLNRAGVDLLPPQPASAEATFFPAKDAPEIVRVEAGTQIAAKKTADRPEIVFETQRNLNVTKAELIACIAADAVYTSDCTTAAQGTASGSFAVFQGDTLRRRIFYLGDDSLFAFPDEESLRRSTIKLEFSFSVPGRPDLDGWQAAWSYYDGQQWIEFGAESVQDLTEGFSKDGAVVFSNLPPLQLEKKQNAWFACELTGGSGRSFLPVLSSVIGSKIVSTDPVSKKSEAAFSAIHNGTAFLPLEVQGEFFPLGQRPERLDAFYLKLDGTFCAAGVTVEVDIDLEELPLGTSTSSQLDLLEMEWSYSSMEGWTTLGRSTKASASREKKTPTFSDGTKAFTQKGLLHFAFPPQDASGGNTPATEREIGKEKGIWLRARIQAGGYGTDVVPGKIWATPEIFAPYVEKITAVTYSNLPDSAIPRKVPDAVHSLVDDHPRNHVADGNLQQNTAPFSGPDDISALYLGFSSPFPAGKWIQLLLDVDEERTGGEEPAELVWEYRNDLEGRWKVLLVSDESAGLRRRGYLGFYGPQDQGKSVQFGREAYWLRVRIQREAPLVKVVPQDLTLTAGGTGTATVSLDFSGSLPSDGQEIVKYLLSSQESTHLVAAAGPDRTGNNAVKTVGDEASLQLDASGSSDLTGTSIATYRWKLLSSEPLMADAGSDGKIETTADEATIQLDASGSFDATGKAIAAYRWKLLASERLVANAGVDQTIPAATDETTVQLDASGSFDSSGEGIALYRWRLLTSPLPEAGEGFRSPDLFLKAIRCNTVPVLNAATVTGEILGSSTGKADQAFATTYAPILPDIKLYVREPDQPPAAELAALEKAIMAAGQADETSPTVIEAEDSGVWVRWRQVDHFYNSHPSSRHFVLDPAVGQVLFGNGERGKIPPIGRDTIRADFYRYHQGISGNVAAGDISVIRNPSGPLALIKRVDNAAGAAGGGDGERVVKVRERGPNTLKHRGKAITAEDFAWLAKDISGEIATAWCLPTRDKKGMTREGYVSVVVVPDSTEAKPFPRNELLRKVQKELVSRALINLAGFGSESRILVKGPEYVEARVSAKIVPCNPEEADEVKFSVMDRLADFLHPLSGGPERRGWELGRDVYLSEIYREMEAAAGVDHVAAARLEGSIQQRVLTLAARRPLSHTFQEGGRVCTFDERIRYVLSGAQEISTSVPGHLFRVCIYGLKIGDRVHIVDGENSILLPEVKITGLSRDGSTVILEMSAAAAETLPPAEWLALLSTDQAIRLPLVKWCDADEQGRAVACLEGFQKDDESICIVSAGQRDPDLQFLRLLSNGPLNDRIFIPEGHLAYSGAHAIEMILEV